MEGRPDDHGANALMACGHRIKSLGVQVTCPSFPSVLLPTGRAELEKKRNQVIQLLFGNDRITVSQWRHGRRLPDYCDEVLRQ